MKKVETKKGVVIETPWLRGTAEAAVYCGMVRSTFAKKAAQVPVYGDETMKFYHCNDLDRWMRGEIPSAMPAAEITRNGLPIRRRRLAREPAGLVDPVTGKVFAPPAERQRRPPAAGRKRQAP